MMENLIFDFNTITGSKILVLVLHEKTFYFDVTKYEEDGELIYFEGKEITSLIKFFTDQRQLLTEEVYFEKISSLPKHKCRASFRNTFILV